MHVKMPNKQPGYLHLADVGARALGLPNPVNFARVAIQSAPLMLIVGFGQAG